MRKDRKAMEQLTKERARELLGTTTTEPHLLQHALAVSAAMGAMAGQFGGDRDYWEAVGLLHDYDYEQYPEEHLQHTATPLRAAGVDEESIHAILAHGWDRCTDVEPVNTLEQSLYAVDALTGLISATARMRPNGIEDLEPSSVNKKFKDKKFAAGVDREVIASGVAMLGLTLPEVVGLCIQGMKPYAAELGLDAK